MTARSVYKLSTSRRASRCKARSARISWSASAEYSPCFVLARRIRSKPSAVRGPVLLPPCSLQRPLAIAGDSHGFPLRVFAPQRGHDCAMGSVVRQSGRRCVGLFFASFVTPSPSRFLRHGPDNGLPAFVDRDVLHRHLLLTAGSVSLQRFHLYRERPRQLVERKRAEEMVSLDSKNPGLTSGEAASAPGFSAPAPDVMLGVWSS